MPLTLVRIDDRLLHGQVTHGWGPVLEPELVIVADDEAAASEWQREAYEASGPGGAEVRVLSLAGCAEAAVRGAFDKPRTLLLVRGPVALLRLIRSGLRVREVNVGGIHPGSDGSDEGAGVRLRPEDAEAFEVMRDLGVNVFVQELPGSPRRPLPNLGGSAKGAPGG